MLKPETIWTRWHKLFVCNSLFSDSAIKIKISEMDERCAVEWSQLTVNL